MLTESRARRTIPRSWHAFFGRFGGLTEAQARAIEPVAQGHSLVLSAPTASGKTEALVGPLIHRLSDPKDNPPGPRILVICPTRALCNDMHRRIHRPVAKCRWQAAIKTGDSPNLPDAKRPQIVITTPESVDSLLSRKPQRLRSVDALILDELHLLDGDPRGDQLQMLITRLRAIGGDLQVLAASATAADADRLAHHYCGDQALTVRAAGGRDRQIELRLVEAFELSDAADLIRDELDRHKGAKLLVFANRRAEVEWLAAALRDRQAFAHHGSLSRAQRLAAEKGFLNAPSGVCIATMTLELGVDIGDVDRVVLLNPPPNVASFTQRIGRANRRGTTICATGLYSSPFDRQRFEHLLDCARAGRLFPEPLPFRPAIIAQQALSLAFQNRHGWIAASVLHNRLPPGARNLWRRPDCQATLRKMQSEGYLHADSQGRFVPDEPAIQDHRYGRIHAHIADSGEVQVVDEATGRALGTARWTDDDYGRAQSGAEGLLLAGQNRRVTRVRNRQVFVEAGDDPEDAQFLSRSGPRYSFELAQDLAAHLAIPADLLPFIPIGDNEWRVDHYAGTLWSRLLACALRHRHFTVTKISPFTLECRLRRAKLPATIGASESIETAVRDWLTEEKGFRQLLKPLQIGPWKRFVPDDLLSRWVVASLRPDAFADWAAGLTIEEIS